MYNIMGNVKIDGIDIRQDIDMSKDNIIILKGGQKVDVEAIKITSNIHKLIREGKKIDLIITGNGEESNNESLEKLVEMLMVSNGIYGIYRTDESVIDREYLDRIYEIKASIKDIKMFLDSGVNFYDDFIFILGEIDDKLNKGEVEDVVSMLKDNGNVLLKCVEYISLLRCLVEKNNLNINRVEAGEIEKAIEDIKNRHKDELDEINRSHKEEIDKLNRDHKEELGTIRKKTDVSGGVEDVSELEELREQRDVYKQESVNLLDENEKLIQRINDRAPTVQAFKQIVMGAQRTNVKNVLYFKEISYVSYTNTLINTIVEMLKIQNVRVKLVVFDNRNEFNLEYMDMLTVNGATYIDNKDRVLSKDNSVAVLDHSTHILEDIFKVENDLVIIYDRLKSKRDLVISNTSSHSISKYYVVNSANQIAKLKAITNEKINNERIITRPYVLEKTIALSNIKDYRNKSNATRLSTWFNHRNVNNKKSDNYDPDNLVIMSILKSAGITLKIDS